MAIMTLFWLGSLAVILGLICGLLAWNLVNLCVGKPSLCAPQLTWDFESNTADKKPEEKVLKPCNHNEGYPGQPQQINLLLRPPLSREAARQLTQQQIGLENPIEDHPHGQFLYYKNTPKSCWTGKKIGHYGPPFATSHFYFPEHANHGEQGLLYCNNKGLFAFNFHYSFVRDLNEYLVIRQDEVTGEGIP